MKKQILNFLFCVLIFLSSTLVFAESGDTPVSQGLRYFIDAMYGATGITLATVAIMIVGMLCLFHVIRWTVFGYTVIGISIIFGADTIVTGITSLVH